MSKIPDRVLNTFWRWGNESVRLRLELYAEIDKNAKLKAENEQLRAERDAAVSDIYRCCDPYGGAADLCDVCSNSDKRPCKPCNWQWRGIEETP